MDFLTERHIFKDFKQSCLCLQRSKLRIIFGSGNIQSFFSFWFYDKQEYIFYIMCSLKALIVSLKSRNKNFAFAKKGKCVMT